MCARACVCVCPCIGSVHVLSVHVRVHGRPTSTLGRDLVRQSESVMNGMPLHMHTWRDERHASAHAHVA